MATNYMNTVPLGREGTGAAQILGPNRALQYALQQNQERQRRLERGQLEYERNQQGYANAFQRSMMETMNTVGGTRYVNPNIRNAIASATNEWARQGGQLMSQGINPFNPYQSEDSRDVSQQHNQSRAEIQSVLAINNQLMKQKDAFIKEYEKDSSKYDVDEFKAYEQWYQDLTPEDIMAGNITPPTVSQPYDIGAGVSKQFGDITRPFRREMTDEAGNPILQEGVEADVPRIMGIVENQFNNVNSDEVREVNRRLRKDFGSNASVDGLLGTTDRAEIRSILDGEFRNPSDNNPIVELMASGINAAPGTEEYERFLDQATDEQLKAEMILDDAKQEAATALVQRVNPTMKQKYDFTLRNQQLRERAAADTARNSLAAYRNTLLSIQKKERGIDEEEDAMIDEATDLDFSMDYGDGDVEEGITVWGAIPQSTPSISVNQGKSVDVYSGKQTDAEGIRGNITAVGLVGVDKDGNVVDGASPDALVDNPSVVKFVPKVVVQDNKRNSHIYDINSIPTESLTDRYQNNIKKAISIQKRTADDLNNKLRNKKGSGSQSTNKTPAQLMREAAGL